MSCCGRAPTTPMTDRHRMRVRYLGDRPVVIKGPVTGADYRFSPREPVQLIEPRDAVGIARSRLLRIEAVLEITDS